MNKWGILLVAILYLINSNRAEIVNHEISWTLKEHDPITIEVGDTITFTYSSNHNVYTLANYEESCEVGVELGANDDSPYVYDSSADTAGVDLYFVCKPHCDTPMAITVHVNEKVTHGEEIDSEETDVVTEEMTNGDEVTDEADEHNHEDHENSEEESEGETSSDADSADEDGSPNFATVLVTSVAAVVFALF
eukprot:TRINITY_DN10908_c0_g1_i1.p1 TRINITY_DN10908_c0_g1~~TRINITY_DN10908_c0_g1_i1.p1  ORF type:complete len:193 (-),score=56.70 TRINITY_DN10908_c0_g1_i1:41-619(-)